ncbi:hypothetical protein E4U54_004487, partial [Claviceps lovelessii]
FNGNEVTLQCTIAVFATTDEDDDEVDDGSKVDGGDVMGGSWLAAGSPLLQAAEQPRVHCGWCMWSKLLELVQCRQQYGTCRIPTPVDASAEHGGVSIL